MNKVERGTLTFGMGWSEGDVKKGDGSTVFGSEESVRGMMTTKTFIAGL